MLSLFACFIAGSVCYGDQTLVAVKIKIAPVIDGNGNDPAWKKAQNIITHDKVADIDVSLKAVFTEKEIYFLVVFPDPDESRIHKPWVWDNDLEMYKMGHDREDCFVFKWNMESKSKDLSVYADESYVADIWFWKACRTNPVGFADDKIQRLSPFELGKAKKMISKTGKTMYLTREGDKGAAAYKSILYSEHKEDRLLQFTNQAPKGSRADIKAKGIWSNGHWTIEFGRMLNTGHEDDIQLFPGKTYPFGISRYEIAGRKPDPRISQPLFGAGDVFEKLMLEFSR